MAQSIHPWRRWGRQKAFTSGRCSLRGFFREGRLVFRSSVSSALLKFKQPMSNVARRRTIERRSQAFSLRPPQSWKSAAFCLPGYAKHDLIGSQFIATFSLRIQRLYKCQRGLGVSQSQQFRQVRVTPEYDLSQSINFCPLNVVQFAVAAMKVSSSPRRRQRSLSSASTEQSRKMSRPERFTPAFSSRNSPNNHDNASLLGSSGAHPRDGVGRAERELSVLAYELIAMCERYGLAHPAERLPAREQLRRYDPTLANRIEALRGRNGYRRLAVYVGAAPPPRKRRRRRSAKCLAKWKQVNFVLDALRPFQRNQNVLPSVECLDLDLRSALKWHGGVKKFCYTTGMLLDSEWRMMRRYACFMLRLVRLSYPSPLPPFMERVETEAKACLHFPPTSAFESAGLWIALQRYGGRRALILRLGYKKATNGLFMGPFSVSFAAELLSYAISLALVSDDSNLAMPSLERMERDGRENLANLCVRFGGPKEVGRRVGLVPIEGDC